MRSCAPAPQARSINAPLGCSSGSRPIGTSHAPSVWSFRADGDRSSSVQSTSVLAAASSLAHGARRRSTTCRPRTVQPSSSRPSSLRCGRCVRSSHLPPIPTSARSQRNCMRARLGNSRSTRHGGISRRMRCWDERELVRRSAGIGGEPTAVQGSRSPSTSQSGSTVIADVRRRPWRRCVRRRSDEADRPTPRLAPHMGHPESRPRAPGACGAYGIRHP